MVLMLQNDDVEAAAVGSGDAAATGRYIGRLHLSSAHCGVDPGGLAIDV